MSEDKYFPKPSGITNQDWEEIYNNGIPVCKEDFPIYLKEKLINHFGIDKEVKDLERKLEEYMEIIKAVAHIGIDWGYGKFELNQDHIDKARKLYDPHEQLKEQGDE